MDLLSIFAQFIIVIFIVFASKYLYKLIKDREKTPNIVIGDITVKRLALTILLYNFIVIGIFTLIYYNISKFSSIPQYLKDGKPHKLSLFSALYECIVTQTTVGFGDVEYNTNLVKFFTMVQMSTLLINFGLLAI